MLGIRTKIRHVSASLKWAKANGHNRTQLGRWAIGLDNVTIGDYSYGEINVLTASKQPKLAIGELCSIAPNVTFVQDFSLLAAQRPALNHPLRGWRQTALQSHPSDRY